MAQHCQFCGKIPMTGHRISHANNVTNRKWHLNLKEVRAVVGGAAAILLMIALFFQSRAKIGQKPEAA